MAGQPDPLDGRENVFPWAKDIFALMHEEARARGMETYGKPLQTFNGRDALKDAMEEVVDLWNYLVQLRLETAEMDTKVVFPLKNIHKAWYEASQLNGPYDGHPYQAEDMNLETGGDSDLGEPVVAPFYGLVIHAKDYGGAIGGVVSILHRFDDGSVVTWQGRHLQKITVKVGDRLLPGTTIGEIGNCQGRYAAHLHHQISVGAVPGPTQNWTDPKFNFVQPSEWFKQNGVPEDLVERLVKKDGK